MKGKNLKKVLAGLTAASMVLSAALFSPLMASAATCPECGGTKEAPEDVFFCSKVRGHNIGDKVTGTCGLDLGVCGGEVKEGIYCKNQDCQADDTYLADRYGDNPANDCEYLNDCGGTISLVCANNSWETPCTPVRNMNIGFVTTCGAVCGGEWGWLDFGTGNLRDVPDSAVERCEGTIEKVCDSGSCSDTTANVGDPCADNTSCGGTMVLKCNEPLCDQNPAPYQEGDTCYRWYDKSDPTDWVYVQHVCTNCRAQKSHENSLSPNANNGETCNKVCGGTLTVECSNDPDCNKTGLTDNDIGECDGKIVCTSGLGNGAYCVNDKRDHNVTIPANVDLTTDPHSCKVANPPCDGTIESDTCTNKFHDPDPDPEEPNPEPKTESSGGSLSLVGGGGGGGTTAATTETPTTSAPMTDESAAVNALDHMNVGSITVSGELGATDDILEALAFAGDNVDLFITNGTHTVIINGGDVDPSGNMIDLNFKAEVSAASTQTQTQGGKAQTTFTMNFEQEGDFGAVASVRISMAVTNPALAGQRVAVYATNADGTLERVDGGRQILVSGNGVVVFNISDFRDLTFVLEPIANTVSKAPTAETAPAE